MREDQKTVAINAVAHFSIPVSDIPKSTQFYTDVVGSRGSVTNGIWMRSCSKSPV